MGNVIKEETLEIRNLNKTFNIVNSELQVLKNININVKYGEFVSIVGESGCGKSTLLKIIAGLSSATEGDVYLKGVKITKPSIQCGMVFQESRLYPWLSVEKNIEFGISKKLPKEEKKRIVQEHIQLVGLTGFEKALPNQLSGGMQQRVSIARALVNRPNVLLLDEPFGALDALTRINMQNEILRIWESERATMILVTHDIDEAIYLGDRVFVMSRKPGTIKKEIQVNLPRPRDRTSDHFARIKKDIYSQFFSTEEKVLEYYI